ncbi:hypothetical protein [Flavobacterium sp. RSP15]|uniref:hypothetical protein n=1 Tax=Flavobacterium sp. RSP15 TaxID=2497485 RepID=UPI000F846604|nr:hypothetical protein [Flavobacterium sp. RSP15]RTY86868.1 hypothetical protein EKM00_08415 [Flavobacterium sp. RSP15]
MGIVLLQSCSSEESTADNVLANTTRGAILRTLKVNQSTFNFFDTTSKWSVNIEEQDSKNGDLLSEVRLYVKHTKNGVTSAEKLVKSYSATAFPKGSNNLPTGEVSATLAETLAKLGITTGGYTTSDKFTMRLELVLTDGRTFTNTNSSSTVVGGVYFSSAFVYSVQFFCPLASAAAFNGNYKVTADAWADYAVGDIVPVQYVSTDGLYTFRIRNTNNPYLNNPSTSYMIVTINPSNAVATVTANEQFDYTGWMKVTVTGSGSVGSCTGDINLRLNFSGSSQNQTFNLVKI